MILFLPLLLCKKNIKNIKIFLQKVLTFILYYCIISIIKEERKEAAKWCYWISRKSPATF